MRRLPDVPEPDACDRDVEKEVCAMTLASHESSRTGQDFQWSQLLVRELWASLAIGMIWLAVLFDAVFGPNIVNSSASGDTSSIPSAIVVAFFAFLATWVVARFGLRQRER
jgi:hypothetical protein